MVIRAGIQRGIRYEIRTCSYAIGSRNRSTGTDEARLCTRLAPAVERNDGRKRSFVENKHAAGESLRIAAAANERQKCRQQASAAPPGEGRRRRSTGDQALLFSVSEEPASAFVGERTKVIRMH
jgi:hypothetical protein